MKLLKLTIAFLAASAVPALIMSVVFIGFDNVLMHPVNFNHILLSLFADAFMVTLAHSLILGLPVFIILWRLKLIRLSSTLISAFMIGALPIPVFCGIEFGHLEPKLLLFFGALGASGGIVFWLLWRYWIQPNEKSAGSKT